MSLMSKCLCCLLIIIPGRAEFLNAQAEPKSDVAFAKSSTAELVNSLKLRPLNPANSLELLLKTKKETVDSYFGFPTAIWICQVCQISSHPAAGIIVDLNQLLSIRRQTDIRQFESVVLFLLAHEKVHQVQYRQYSGSISHASRQEREAYEAQADILAGKLLISTLDKPSDPAETQSILDALRIAYDLGTEQYAIADHPSHAARLTAARLGMSAGMVVKLNQLGGQLALSSAAELRRKLDIRSDEDSTLWSLRTAKRVINYELPAIVSLVKTGKHIEWHKTVANPTVAYEITYQNRADHPISVDLEVQSIAAPRDDLDNIFRWLKIDAKDHLLSMPPHSETVISGSLRWYADQSLEPRLISPPTATALVSVTYSADTQSHPAVSANEGLNASSTAQEREGMASVLSTILTAAATGFIDLRCGPGNKIGNEVMYPSCSRFPAADDTTVWIPEPGASENPRILGEFNSYAPERARAVEYDDIVHVISGYLRTIGDWKEIQETGPSSKGVLHRFSLNLLRVTISHEEDDTIYLTIERMPAPRRH